MAEVPGAPDQGAPIGAVRDRAAREARVVGLKGFETPSFESVEKRRVQLWLLSTILLLLLAGMTVLSVWTPAAVDSVVTPLILRVSVLVLTFGFSVYSYEKESHLRKLSSLLLEERMLTVALSNRVKELSLLLEAGKAMNSALELDQVLMAILRSSVELLEASSASIMLLEPGGTELRSVCAAGNDRATDARATVGVGIAGTVASTREPLLISGQADANRFPGLIRRDESVDSAMCVPLLHRDELLGVINITASAARAFSEYDLRALNLFAEQAASTIAKARLFEAEREHAEQLAHLAFHDPLTGLPNRVLFIDRAHQALARGARRHVSLAVMFIDLDRFKGINDTLGHSAGDELLVQVADRLRSVIRPEDTLSRFGGDEFVLLCEDLGGEIEAVGLATRLEEALAKPFTIAGTEVAVTASLGIAIGSGADDDPDALVRDADTAMYRAKEQGKARHEVFNGALRARSMDRLRVENMLRHAIDNERLRVAYQPIIDLASGAAVCAEALARLDDPGLGLLEPDDFMEVAHESGLIVPLGDWVIREACRQARRWGDDAAGTRPLGIAVNLSGSQTGRAGLAEFVAEALDQSGLSPELLYLEISEIALTELGGPTIESLAAIAATGVHIGIDDFGTGQSSLTYLKRFPVDFVKIHGSFVAGLLTNAEDAAIVESVINLGRALHLTTIAEGVEQEDQATRLREMGCDLAQGYYFARPGSVLSVERTLLHDAASRRA